MKRYQIEFSRWQVGHYLKSWGLYASEANKKTFEPPVQVKQWLQEEVPAIKKRAKKEKGVIYFGDETVCETIINRFEAMRLKGILRLSNRPGSDSL